jgi:hypothetical protein
MRKSEGENHVKDEAAGTGFDLGGRSGSTIQTHMPSSR